MFNRQLKNGIKKTIVLGVIVLIVWSCSHEPVVNELSASANPDSEIVKFNIGIGQAKEEQVNVLAPESFKTAEDYLKDAKKSLSQKEKPTETLYYISKGQAYLNRANELAELARTKIGDVVIARQKAIMSGAQTFFSADFKHADNLLKDETEDIEKNKSESVVKNRSELQLNYMDLELRAIKQARLKKANDTIEQAVIEGAKVFAPQS